MTNELSKKYDEKNGVVITYDKKGRSFVSFPVGGVPLQQFEEWNTYCERGFNSNRWQKIFLDHRMNQAYSSMNQQVEEIVPQEQPSKVKDETMLLSGEILEE